MIMDRFAILLYISRVSILYIEAYVILDKTINFIIINSFPFLVH